MNLHKLKYIISVILYGTNGLYLRSVIYPSEMVVFFRGFFGTLTILLIGMLMKRKVDTQAIKRNLPVLLASGAFLGLNWVFLFAAFRVTTIAIASLCNYMAPIIVVVITLIAAHEKPDMKKLACVSAAIVGIVLISGICDGGRVEVNVPGLALGLSSAVAFVGIILFNRKLKDIDALDKSIVQLGVSAIVVLPYVIYMNRGTTFAIDPLSIVLMIALGVVNTGIAYIFYFGAMSEISVESIAILGYLEPVVSIFISAVILKETITIFGILGAILILAAAFYNELSSIKK